MERIELPWAECDGARAGRALRLATPKTEREPETKLTC
jgi:hypothetical protein